MTTLNESLTAIVDPDFNLGTIDKVIKNVTYEWIVDQPEQSHIEIVAEYENGGKDIRCVIDSPEVGHWIVMTDDGKEIPIGYEVPNDWPKEAPIYKTVELNVYRPYTDKELAEIEQAKLDSENQLTMNDIMLAMAELGVEMDKIKNG